jgi:DNA ligase D-like protein (predicted 3'-phosphoesterase)
MATKKGPKLVSWVIRKGPSLNPKIKRLAIETTDHALAHGKFEGIIEKGYGAGKTIIWDTGTYKIIKPAIKSKEDLKKIKMFEFELSGKKLRGRFLMIRTKQGWIMRKKYDKYADASIDVTMDAPKSIVSGKRIEEI